MPDEVRIDGAKLKRLREEARLTQGQLAVKSHVTQSLISLIEAGKRPNATLATIGRLASALAVQVDDLLLSPRLSPDELPDFHMYISRKFKNNPRLQRALVAAYEAIVSVREEEEDRIKKAQERTKPGGAKE